MRRASAERRRFADAIALAGWPRVVVAGEALDLSGKDADADRTALATLLYRRLYCRPHAPASWASDGRGVRVLVDRLSSANRGRGCWEPGWTVQAIEADGTLCVQKPHDALRLWVAPDRYQSGAVTIAPGDSGRVQIGKEYREMLPGFYMALGNADALDGAAANKLVRFYWHLTAAAAPAWIAALTELLNDRAIAFRAKALSDPAAYGRADAGVLYVAREQMAAALHALPEIHRYVARRLRPETPIFTKPLARGLGFADDPGHGQSFGQHRCELVADAILGLGCAGERTKEAVARTIARRFSDSGIDPRTPWLNPGSEDAAFWPESA